MPDIDLIKQVKQGCVTGADGSPGTARAIPWPGSASSAAHSRVHGSTGFWNGRPSASARRYSRLRRSEALSAGTPRPAHNAGGRDGFSAP